MGAVIRQSTVHWLLGLGPDIPGALRRVVVALLDVDVAIVVADRLVLDVLAVLVVRELSELALFCRWPSGDGRGGNWRSLTSGVLCVDWRPRRRALARAGSQFLQDSLQKL